MKKRRRLTGSDIRTINVIINALLHYERLLLRQIAEYETDLNFVSTKSEEERYRRLIDSSKDELNYIHRAFNSYPLSLEEFIIGY